MRSLPIYREPGLGDKGVVVNFPTDTISVYWSADLVLTAAMALAGCGERVGEYLPVSAVARGGFLTDQGALAEMDGPDVRLWGFVDQGHLYGDADAKRVLGEWWGGAEPAPDHWRLDAKAREDETVGCSFAVLVPNDAGRDELPERCVTDARARRARKVFVTGRLSTFPAPAQVIDLTGLSLQLRSSQDVRRDSPEPG